LPLPFIAYDPTPQDYWRGIILYGRNVASYKFALGRALLDLKPIAGSLVKLEELAVPFSSHLCTHLKEVDKQGTFASSQFLIACRRANDGELSHDGLVGETVKRGFNNVIDAFHVIGGKIIPHPFFLDERRQHGGIRVTDAFSELLEVDQALNLPFETEARWNLVETAWRLGLSPSLLGIQHDIETETLYVMDSALKRKSVSGARDALSGYQKGHCFYCFDSFILSSDNKPDVDHFFPHLLKAHWPSERVDGVWNLVLACRRCNRGIEGKSAHIPSKKLLERLHTRNEWLIASHHPLRETLISQTGPNEERRCAYLNKHHDEAKGLLAHEWEPTNEHKPLF